MMPDDYEKLRASLLDDDIVKMSIDDCRKRINEIYIFVASNTDLSYTKSGYLLKQLDSYKVAVRAKSIQASVQ